MMAAKTVARDRLLGRPTTFVTTTNIKKATQFRGEKPFEHMVRRFMQMSTSDPDRPANAGMPSNDERFPNKNNRGFEPKLSEFEVPGDQPGESEEPARAPKRHARPMDSEGSKFETEAMAAAAAEAEATADIGSQIVPRQAKRAAKNAEKKAEKPAEKESEK